MSRSISLLGSADRRSVPLCPVRRGRPGQRSVRSGSVTLVEIGFLFLAGIGAGTVGSTAGLASLVSYPALLLVGLPPVAANVTNSVGLIGITIGSVSPAAASAARPGAAGAARAPGRDPRRWPRRCTAARRLTRHVREGGAVPGGRRVGAAPAVTADPVARPPPWSPRRSGRGVLLLFLACGYGGYFGAAAGVMILALLLARTDRPLPVSNAIKNVFLGSANATAAVLFTFRAPVEWAAVPALLVGCVAGGWIGPAVVRRVPAPVMRRPSGSRGCCSPRAWHGRRSGEFGRCCQPRAEALGDLAGASARRLLGSSHEPPRRSLPPLLPGPARARRQRHDQRGRSRPPGGPDRRGGGRHGVGRRPDRGRPRRRGHPWQRPPGRQPAGEERDGRGRRTPGAAGLVRRADPGDARVRADGRARRGPGPARHRPTLRDRGHPRPRRPQRPRLQPADEADRPVPPARGGRAAGASRRDLGGPRREGLAPRRRLAGTARHRRRPRRADPDRRRVRGRRQRRRRDPGAPRRVRLPRRRGRDRQGPRGRAARGDGRRRRAGDRHRRPARRAPLRHAGGRGHRHGARRPDGVVRRAGSLRQRLDGPEGGGPVPLRAGHRPQRRNHRPAQHRQGGGGSTPAPSSSPTATLGGQRDPSTKGTR